MTERYKYNREGYLNESFRLFHLRDTAGQERDFHFHDFDKLVILKSGSVNYMVEGTDYSLKPNDILLVRHHMIHKAVIDVSVPYERIIIYIDSSFMDRYVPEGRLPDCFSIAEKRRFCLVRPDGEDIPQLSRLLDALEEVANDTELGADVMRIARLMELLVLIDRMMQNENSGQEEAAKYNEKIASVLSYINENLSKNMSVDELASKSYLSRYHFMRLFKSQTGCTVHNYIRQKRLVLAARLIRDGMSAQNAASECGFSDYSAFHRAFTSTFGVSPGKIKKM